MTKRAGVLYQPGSRKAHHLENNPRISLLFPWHMLERQVMVTGKAERLSTLEVVKYFHSRPRDSQIRLGIKTVQPNLCPRCAGK
jgi:pyridoxine/pyridoxamine 5'-phosphate oxidase